MNDITLVLRNSGFHPVCLEEGRVLGTLQEATLLSLKDDMSWLGEENPTVIRALHAASSKTKNDHKVLLDTLHWKTDSLSEDEAMKLKEFLSEYQDVFALNNSELSSTNLVHHHIETGDVKPIHQHARRIPFALREKVDEMVQDMLDQGVIQHSHSPWASPIILVAKRDGTTRFCVDYRKLNSVIKMDVFPLPRIDDSIDILSHSRYFSTLDLRSGYWQVRMASESIEKTAFATHSGLYEFVVMPFGLCNAPSTFQRLMERVLTGLARDVCIVYLDDILVMATTFEEHLFNLRCVFDRLRNAGLRLKPSKCYLARRKVEYLGYVISDRGVAADPKKIKAVQEFPTPTNLKQLRSFLGLASYYRRFICNFSKVANPLFALMKKDAVYEWTPQCQGIFEELKKLLTSSPILAFPDFSKGFLLATDASGVGLGAVLSQVQDDSSIRPIAYASRTLQKHESNYGVTELEALGVVWAVKHFRSYLYGHRCDVYTDHEALKSLLNTPQPSGRLARWGMALQELDIHIHYRPGKVNTNADALSHGAIIQTDNLTVPWTVMGAVQADVQPAKEGEEITEISEVVFLEDGVLPNNDQRARELSLTQAQYEVIDNVLYHIEPDKTLRIVLPTVDQKVVFDEVHSGILGAHLREAKIHGQLSKHYWWPRMRADINTWCRECKTCAAHNVGQGIKPPLTPIPVAGPFDRVGVDFIKFPKSKKGNQYAIVLVDYLTKWPEVYATKDQSSLTIAKLLVEHIVSRHGVPGELLSDRGKAFLSKLMYEVYKLLGIKKVNTTAYHPQTDGLVERFNRTLTSMLAKTVQKQGRDWDEHLPYVLYAYRTNPLRNHPFTYYMVGMLDYLQMRLSMPLFFVKPLIWMTTEQR